MSVINEDFCPVSKHRYSALKQDTTTLSSNPPDPTYNHPNLPYHLLGYVPSAGYKIQKQNRNA
jgi:hypothetical protein